MRVRFEGTAAPMSHAARRLERVHDPEDRDVVLTCDPSGGEPQSYLVTNAGRRLVIRGGGALGAMYGGLAVAEWIELGSPPELAPWGTHTPYLRHRGLKVNLPLDARTPSYSDNGDSAQLTIADVWTESFWYELFDAMADARYNVLSLWSLHPFPSLVVVPEYPELALHDVWRPLTLPTANTLGLGMYDPQAQHETLLSLTPEEKVAFWRRVMELAGDRGIEVYLFTWNIYPYGVEQAGITADLASAQTRHYYRCSVRALLRTYPLLAGIGVTAGENMQRGQGADAANEEWLRATYGVAVADVLREDPTRQVRLIHRTHWANLAEVEARFADLGLPLEFSYKYSSAHLHSMTVPPYLEHDRFLEQLPADARLWLTVRDDDHYLLRTGDPSFIRDYVLGMPRHSGLQGFYFGPDGYTLGREHVVRHPTGPTRELVFKRQWYLFGLLGRLGYDPSTPVMLWSRRLAVVFGLANGDDLLAAWRAASGIVPLVNQFHHEGNHYDFQWYPEGCTSHPLESRGFHDVWSFVECRPMPTSGLVSIPDHVAGVTDGVSPPEVAGRLLELAKHVEQYVGTRGAGSRSATNDALSSVLLDLAALAALGRYYAAKLSGAVALHRATTIGGDPQGTARADAVTHITAAAELWRRYADLVHAQYVPQRLARLGGLLIDLYDIQAHVDRDVMLVREAVSDP